MEQQLCDLQRITSGSNQSHRLQAGRLSAVVRAHQDVDRAQPVKLAFLDASECLDLDAGYHPLNLSCDPRGVYQWRSIALACQVARQGHVGPGAT